MNEDIYDNSAKIIIVFLSMLLFIGSGVMYWNRHIKAPAEVKVERARVEPEYSIEYIEQKLIERSKVNINAADKQEIMNIPGIGPSLAEKIIAYRKEHGSFLEKEDLLNISGIGPCKFKKFKEHIKI